MRIGLNLLYLLPGLVGGTETYARGLLEGLAAVAGAEEFIIFVNRENEDWKLPDSSRFIKVLCPVSALNRAERYWYEQMRLPALLRKYRIDVLHSLGYVMPLRPNCPAIVTIHDLNYRTLPMPWKRRMALQFFVKHSARRADRIIAVSNFTRAEISSRLKVPLEKIRVIHEAPNPGTVRPQHSALPATMDIGKPYLAAFSSPSPHKNLNRLLEAFAQVRKIHPQLQLVVIGHPPQTLVRGPVQRNPPGMLFTGYLADEAVTAILSGALMYVHPSLYEGFGLPVVEAMALGVPVICSNRASLPEVAGDAALFFDPVRTEQIRDRILELFESASLRQDLIERGRRNAQRFSWPAAGRDTLALFHQVLAEKR